MQINMPFAYTVKYKLRGKRLEEEERLRGDTIIRIRDVEREVVTPAFLVANLRNAYDQFSPVNGANGNQRQRMILEFENHFWRELMSAEDFKRLNTSDEVDEEEYREASHNNPFARHKKYGAIGWSPWSREHVTTIQQLQRDVEIPIREMSNDHGAEHMDKLREASNELICVGGRIYQKCNEPCWTVEVKGDAVLVHVVDIDDWESDVQSDGRYPYRTVLPTEQLFPMHRRAEAIELAQSIAKQSGKKVTVYGKGGSVKESESLATVPGESLSLERAAAAVVSYLGKELKGYSKEAIYAWVELKRYLDNHGGRASEEMASLLGDFVYKARSLGGKIAVSRARYGDAAETVLDIPAYNRNEHMDSAMEAAILAISRWNSRPETDAEWVHLSVPGVAKVGNIEAFEINELFEAKKISRTTGECLDEACASATRGDGHLIGIKDNIGIYYGAILLDNQGTAQAIFGNPPTNGHLATDQFFAEIIMPNLPTAAPL